MADFAVLFNDYEFPNPDSISWNFADLVPQTERMFGVSGGYDAYGNDPAPAAIGNVSLGFNLVANTMAEMQGLIDEVAALAALGKQTLTYQPLGPYNPRWCKARLNALPRSLRAENGLMLQPLTITFQVNNPVWYEAEDTDTVNASGLLTTATVNNAGTALTLCNITIACGAAQTALNPIIRRKVNGVVVDEVRYTGTIANNKSLVINTRAHRVLYDGASALSSFDFDDASWFRLAAGDNSIEVIFGNGGSAATVTLAFYPAYV